jgi:hypothetical protein
VEYFEYTVPQFLYFPKSVPRHASMEVEARTCSADVLIKTGCPLKQLRNIGINFFKKDGYMGPDV